MSHGGTGHGGGLSSETTRLGDDEKKKKNVVNELPSRGGIVSPSSMYKVERERVGYNKSEGGPCWREWKKMAGKWGGNDGQVEIFKASVFVFGEGVSQCVCSTGL